MCKKFIDGVHIINIVFKMISLIMCAHETILFFAAYQTSQGAIRVETPALIRDSNHGCEISSNFYQDFHLLLAKHNFFSGTICESY